MKLLSNPKVIKTRSLLRKFGLTKIFRYLVPSAGYEAAFDKALLEAIKKGDVVWDVGANIGFYTIKFANATGSLGRVFAFEPFPSTILELTKSVTSFPNIVVRNVALGRHHGSMSMMEGHDDIGATSRVVESSSDEGIQIEIISGNEAFRAGLAEFPNVIKIDTEGYELDVLVGISELLTKPELRAVFIEVHFGLLSDRGMPNAPTEIEEILLSNRFQTSWLDASHIVGIRAPGK